MPAGTQLAVRKLDLPGYLTTFCVTNQTTLLEYTTVSSLTFNVSH